MKENNKSEDKKLDVGTLGVSIVFLGVAVPYLFPSVGALSLGVMAKALEGIGLGALTGIATFAGLDIAKDLLNKNKGE